MPPLRSAVLLLVLACAFFQVSLANSCYARLYAADPIRSGIDFRTAYFGQVFGNAQVYNWNTDLRYGVDGPNVFMAAPQGSEQGWIAPMNGNYASLAYYEGSVVNAQWNDTAQKLSYTPVQVPAGTATLTALAGTLYLVNITDTGPSWWRLVKLLVVEVANTSSVFIRWEVLYDNEPASDASSPFICAANLGEQELETDIIPSSSHPPSPPSPPGPPGPPAPPAQPLPSWVKVLFIVYGCVMFLLLGCIVFLLATRHSHSYHRIQ